MSHPESRAARRALARKHPNYSKRKQSLHDIFNHKSWSQMCLRRNKLHRAAKLGKLWPHGKSQMDELMAEADDLNVLFICSRNQWRSPTGEAVFRRHPGVSARSAGTSQNARRPVQLADIRWADLILVMEDKHAARLRATFRQDLRHKVMHVLDIPDEYRYMDADLVAELENGAGALIAQALDT